jgi:hypothetical protein
MGRVYGFVSRPAFVLDPHSITRESGRQIDWGYVPDDYRIGGQVVTMNGAASAAATSITVDPLPVALTVGMNLYFGQSQEFARVTAPAAAGATTVSVESLPQALEDNGLHSGLGRFQDRQGRNRDGRAQWREGRPAAQSAWL